MSAPVKYYYDLLSQPSRALYILFKLTNTPFESLPVALRNGVHLSDDYKTNINRFQKVPCINDNGFKLSESVAILRYMKNTTKTIPDSLYPTDLKEQAKVDEYLEWQHNNTRITCAMYFQLVWLRPLMSGHESDPKMVAEAKKRMENCLDEIEKLWLGGNKYIVGNSLTVADIFAACEIEQPRMAGYDPKEGRPNLAAWLDRVRSELNPHYLEAHKILNKVAEKSAKL